MFVPHHSAAPAPRLRQAAITSLVEHWLAVALKRAKLRLEAVGDQTGVAEIDAALAGTHHDDSNERATGAGITRGPGHCLDCKAPQGAAHSLDCYFAPFVTGRAVAAP